MHSTFASKNPNDLFAILWCKEIRIETDKSHKDSLLPLKRVCEIKTNKFHWRTKVANPFLTLGLDFYKAASTAVHGPVDGRANGAVRKTNVRAGVSPLPLCCTQVSLFVTLATLNCSAEIVTAAILNSIQFTGVLLTFVLLIQYFGNPLRFLQKYIIVQYTKQ